MDLEEARALVATALSNGLEYSSQGPLDSPKEQFDQLFAEVGTRLSEGLEVTAWWQPCRLYRPSSFGNDIASATATFAQADLPGLVAALDAVQEARLQYELTYWALLRAPHARYCQWLELAATPALLGLGVATALRALMDSQRNDADAETACTDWAIALRNRPPEVRSRIWWQLAALAPMTSPMHGWSTIAEALWGAASREIEIGEKCCQVYAPLIDRLRSPCGTLNSLYRRLATRGTDDFRTDATSILREDFSTRLNADEWSLPSLENAPERMEYLPAVGWAIAHDVQTAGAHARWWETVLAEHLVPVPRWRRPGGWRKRCGLVLLAACCAAHHLLEVGAPQGETFRQTLLALADTELPGLVGPGLAALHPLRALPLALVDVECRVSPNGSRVLRFAGLVPSAAGLHELIEVIQMRQLGEPPWLADINRLKTERERYEMSLFPERQS